MNKTDDTTIASTLTKSTHLQRVTLDEKTGEKVEVTITGDMIGLTPEQIEYACLMYGARNFYNNTRPSQATDSKSKTYEADVAFWRGLGSEHTIKLADYITLPGSRVSKTKRLDQMTLPELKIAKERAIADMDAERRVLIDNLIKKHIADAVAAAAEMGIDLSK